MKYTDLVFDLYGTLVDIHTEENDTVWEKTAIFFGFHGAPYTGAQLHADFRAAMALRQAKEGQSYECFPDIPFEEVLAELFRAKGIVDTAETLGFQAAQLFRILSIEYIKLYPKVPEALTALRERGYRLWLLSNAQRVFTEYELRHLGLARYFDGIYLSSDYRCRKPDTRFFRALIGEHGLSPKKCLMIGNDRDTDIAGAKAVGMDTLYLHTNLTPAEQREADPTLLPGVTDMRGSHFEYEGSDWEKITRLITGL